jgi:TolB protein
LAYATSGGELVIHNLETGKAKVLELGGLPGHWDFPAFAPDGKRLVCTYFEGDAQDRARLAIINLETRRVRFPVDQYGPQMAPVWAPEGGRILYGYGHCNDACGRIIQEPWVFNLNNGKARQMLMTGANTADFVWDPAGTRFSFSSDQAGNFDIWTFRPGAERPTRVTNAPRFDGSPAFAPDGRRLAFISNRSGTSKIWILDLDANSLTLFDPLGADQGAAYKDVEWK